MAYEYSYDKEEKKYEAPKLKTNRSMLKLNILGILTLGLYSIFFYIPFSCASVFLRLLAESLWEGFLFIFPKKQLMKGAKL